MVELVPGIGVYLHKDQFQNALNKAAPVVSPRAKTDSLEIKRDGKLVSRYLVSVFFFLKQQLANSSLTNSDMAQYPALNQELVDAVIAFSVCNSDTSRGEILRAMRASQKSKRCNGKKSDKTVA
ncbi:hypothetical protein ACF0H5_003513 [Mactra antiquata]